MLAPLLWIAALAQDPAAARADPAAELRAALLARRGADGVEYGLERLDPLLWAGTSEHLLAGESHARALAALDAFLAADLPSAPLERVLLQRDLWAVFDWAAQPDPAPEERAARTALCERLAHAIERSALPRAELEALPDAYAAAVRSPALAAHLPTDLFAPDGPWVPITGQDFTRPTPGHDGAFPRSVFTVLASLPEGRAATEAWLASLAGTRTRAAPDAGGPPQFPPGTRFALVRRALALDTALEPVATGIVEKVQLRTYVEVPEGVMLLHNDVARTQRFTELVLSRAKLLAGANGGLELVREEDADFPFVQFRSHGHDPFEDPESFRAPTVGSLATCGICHRDPGVHSVLSVVGDVAPESLVRVRAGQARDAVVRALDARRATYAFGYLRGLRGR